MRITNNPEDKKQNPDSNAEQRNFSWENLYAQTPAEEMPWYTPVLDSDLENELRERNITNGTFLDLGTGPATQAIELDKKGFAVTGTDISKDAVKRASKLSNTVCFIHDDILNSKLNKQFDYIFDRGCFHVMSSDKRPKYVETVSGLLSKDGFLFLKCFSHREPDFGRGPYRFTNELIQQTFSNHFDILSIDDSEFEGNRKPNPKALFVVMRRK